jgi:dihydroorotase
MTPSAAPRTIRIIDPRQQLDAQQQAWISRAGKLHTAPPPGAEGGFTAISPTQGEHEPLWLVPALVDLYARLREPGATHKASIASEAHAASAAGVSIVASAPDTEPCADSTAVIELIRDRARSAFEAGGARIVPLGAISKGLLGESLSEYASLTAAGCVGFSSANSPISNSNFLRRAMQYAKSFDVTLHLHPIDKHLSEDGVAHDGRVAARLGLPGIPSSAETLALARDLMLIEETGVRAHISRISCARSVELVAEAKKRGARVSCDVALTHLFLCENDLLGYRAAMHLQPPLRSANDRDALREGLRNGVIDAICSDHAPHDRDAKLAPFPMTEAGASTIEALLPLSLKLIDEGILTPSRWVQVVSTNPARILGLEQRDWLLLNRHARVRLSATAGGISLNGSTSLAEQATRQTSLAEQATRQISRGKNLAFEGWEVQGQAERIVFAQI